MPELDLSALLFEPTEPTDGFHARKRVGGLWLTNRRPERPTYQSSNEKYRCFASFSRESQVFDGLWGPWCGFKPARVKKNQTSEVMCTIHCITLAGGRALHSENIPRDGRGSLGHLGHLERTSWCMYSITPKHSMGLGCVCERTTNGDLLALTIYICIYMYIPYIYIL